jgi:uncharacterized protein HemY
MDFDSLSPEVKRRLFEALNAAVGAHVAFDRNDDDRAAQYTEKAASHLANAASVFVEE